MLILKYNTLSADDLFVVERRFLRWLDNKGPVINPEFNVLNYTRTDVYGHLLGLFAKLKVLDTLEIDASQMLDFFIDVDAAYLDAPYHSFYHAVDIVTVLYYMLTELVAVRYLSPLDVATLLLSALCHDAGHPGYTNLYQVNCKTPIAKRYNNTSVLESFSVEIGQDLLHKHKLLKSLEDHHQQTFLEKFENMILSTDMVYHYDLQEQLGSLEEMVSYIMWLDTDDTSDADSLMWDMSWCSDNDSSTMDDNSSSSSSCSAPDDEGLVLDEKQRQDLSRILLHAADISNTVRPWPISKQWSDLIVQEFFRQGDAEKAAGMQVSPGMDREHASQPAISLKFGDFVVKPYFEALASVLPAGHVFLDHLAHNREEWVRLKDGPTIVNAASPPPPLSLHERQFPVSLLPAQPVLNPTGRRVSVPAGLVVIPDYQYYYPQRRRKSTRHVIGFRSTSHSTLRPINNDVMDFFFYRRKSEQLCSYNDAIFESPMVI
ncbi:hypothetical protein DFQ28_007730 [Apophysomyces sp. BC1034]|nr:hypothetical protein DFQ30_000523 [Apophysomyces sp. BC1015]KAG0175891.1 hypothetical protein DFQ29_006822 [Apophysomyces sp. BC1021]KAG0186484.1 hypothetical protein DFQ28_007730 [Apophysomyces sp. BC1034]